MASKIYTNIKDLEVQDPEVYNFGVWLGTNHTTWEHDDSDEDNLPKNKHGESMEYPWDDFEYVVVPDTEDDLDDTLQIANSLGSSFRLDIEEMERVFFVIK